MREGGKRILINEIFYIFKEVTEKLYMYLEKFPFMWRTVEILDPYRKSS